MPVAFFDRKGNYVSISICGAYADEIESSLEVCLAGDEVPGLSAVSAQMKELFVFHSSKNNYLPKDVHSSR